MNNFASIDQNRIATAKQIWAASCHCSSIHASTPSERFGLNKVFHAILNKFYDDQDAKMTHGDVQNIFEHDVVPAHFVSLVRKPKASKKAKAKTAKPKAAKATQTIEEAIENIDSKKVIKPVAKVANNTVAKAMDKRITKLETKVSEVDSKLDAILAILQK
jgi:predicted nucleotide-binding protein (sugar kinase/HSP70/actin superfamily)